MIIVITLSLISVACLLFLAGYKMGVKAERFYWQDEDNELTPIYDGLANDFPSTAVKLVAPVTMEVAEQ